MNTFFLSGTVYGALLNDPAELLAMGQVAHQKPHGAPPAHPVLQLKPRNTMAKSGANVSVPAQVAGLVVGASLGIVLGKTACRVSLQEAKQYIGAYMAMIDYFMPHESHYRPAVRMRARDGSCVLGEAVAASNISNPDTLAVHVSVDGMRVNSGFTAGRIRSVSQLLCDITDFMTLNAGDILMLGVAHDAPIAKPGQVVTVQIDGLGSVTNTITQEQAP